MDHIEYQKFVTPIIRPLMRWSAFLTGGELKKAFVNGSADLRSQKMALSITRCNMQFGQIEAYGKKPSLLGFKMQPQDIVLYLRSSQPHVADVAVSTAYFP